MASLAAFLNWLGDLLLAGIAVLTVVNALHAEGKERAAQRVHDQGQREGLIADALTLRALNTLQKPRVLLAIAAGLACKLAFVLWQAAAWLFGL